MLANSLLLYFTFYNVEVAPLSVYNMETVPDQHLTLYTKGHLYVHPSVT